MNIKINLDEWPRGEGLSIETSTQCYGFAGRCGGGVGRSIKSWKVNDTQALVLYQILTDELRENNIINEVK